MRKILFALLISLSLALASSVFAREHEEHSRSGNNDSTDLIDADHDEVTLPAPTGVPPVLVALAAVKASPTASVLKTATFVVPGVYTQPTTSSAGVISSDGAYKGTDATGLIADAVAWPDARNVWNVYSSAVIHLSLANTIDALHPSAVTLSLPGHTFTASRIQLFGYLSGNARAAGATLNYELQVYHGGATPVIVPLTIKSKAITTVNLATNPAFVGASKVVLVGLNTGETDLIALDFTAQ